MKKTVNDLETAIQMDRDLMHAISTRKGKSYYIDANYVYYCATINGYKIRWVYTLSKTYCLRQLIIDEELAHLLGFTSEFQLRRRLPRMMHRQLITPKALKRRFM